MAVKQAFLPAFTEGIALVPDAAAVTYTLGAGNKALMIASTGTVAFYVRTFKASEGAVNATAADYLILAGSKEVISKPQDHDSLSVISAGAATTGNAIPGEGF